ncbi:glycosyltransferase [Azospirillum sp. SYSU D00513]|uniref:glycosyltransferase n=1 Tax=Azospirillum sp. SYSU D00513 TaxID=2812561 RepID=UPI001A96306B|nr:glycosyltransferase [Azospirillum sp. SYSU D00513]
MPFPTVFAVDPMMIDRSGHHHHLMTELGAVLAARAVGFRLFVPRSADRESVVAPFGAVACLDHLPSARVFPMPIADIGAVNYRFHLDLARIGEAAGPADTLFFPRSTHRSLFGILRWLEERPAGTRPHCVLTLEAQECFDGFDGTVHRRNTEIYATILRGLAALDGPKPVLLAFSSFYAKHLEALADGAIHVRPFPFSYLRPREALPRPGPETAPAIGLFGNTGWEQKGLLPLLDAARRLLRNGRALRLIIQIDEPTEEGRLAPYRDVLEDRRVILLRGGLPPEEYDRWLGSCSLAVLPYGPAYRYQPSSILFEALSRGRPTLLPERSEMARDVAALGVRQPLFREWNGEALAAAIEEALERQALYEQEALKAAARLRQEAPGTERLADLLDARRFMSGDAAPPR